MEEVIAISPIITDIFNKGLVLEHLGRYEEAIKCYKKAIEIDSELLSAHKNLGGLLFILN